MDFKKWRTRHGIDLLRAAVQILFFLLVPAVFAVGFGGLKALASALRAGELNGISVAIKTSFALLLLTAVFGRFLCGWVCSFGAYTDLVYAPGPENQKKAGLRNSLRQEIEMAEISASGGYFVPVCPGFEALLRGTSPWDVFGQLIALRPRLSGYGIGMTVLILVTIGSAFIERFYCRYLCAFGACFAIAAEIRVLSIKKPREGCALGCRMCSSHCPMGLPLYEKDAAPGAECIRCMRCIEICRRHHAGLKLGPLQVPVPVYAVLTTVLILAVFFYLGLIK